MQILIVDDAIAKSKAVRGLLSPPGRKKRPISKSAAKGAPAAGHLFVSVAQNKKGKAKGKSAEDCGCHGLDLGDQPEQAATILDALGTSLLNRGCLDQGALLIELALKIRRKFFGNNHPVTASSLNSYSRVQRERGDFDGAATAVQDSLRINRAVFGNGGLPVAYSLYELGVVQLAQGAFPDAEKSAREGLAILSAVGLLDTDPYTTRLMDVLGRAQCAQNDPKAAADTYESLLKIDRKQLGTDQHPKYATHLANYGLVKEALQKPKQAEAAYRSSIDLYENTLNRRCHPNLIDTYANLGSLLRVPPADPKRLKEAGDHLQKALDLGLQVRGANHVLVGNDYANLARWHYDTGNTKTALKNFGLARKIYDKNVASRSLPADHSFIAEALTWQGRLLVESGTATDAKQAEPLLTDAIAKWPVQRGANTVGEGVARACLGRAQYLQGNNPKQGCTPLCEGFAIIKASPLADPAFVKRMQGWIKQQDCECVQPPTAA
jgi:tetratricopeptide (TPR) repeat protein